jgi:putative transposon-encoded protein
MKKPELQINRDKEVRKQKEVHPLGNHGKIPNPAKYIGKMQKGEFHD